MSSTLKASLISLVTLVGVTVVTYLSNNLSSFGIPATYLPLVAGLLALVMHWVPSPKQLVTPSLSTSAQPTISVQK